MTTETTIFLVTAGKYSEYAVHGVFSTSALAQAYIDAVRWHAQPRIEERPLDPGADHLRQGLFWYEVLIKLGTADVLSVKKNTPVVLRADNTWVSHDDEFYRKVADGVFLAFDHLAIHCWAKDEAHAVKIAMEKRAAWLAMEQR